MCTALNPYYMAPIGSKPPYPSDVKSICSICTCDCIWIPANDTPSHDHMQRNSTMPNEHQSATMTHFQLRVFTATLAVTLQLHALRVSQGHAVSNAMRGMAVKLDRLSQCPLQVRLTKMHDSRYPKGGRWR